MELQQRRKNRLSDFDYNQNGAYFVTICTQDRKKILSDITVGTGVLDCPQIQLSNYGKIADKFIRQLDDFYEHISVERYVIMPDHIHILLAVQNSTGLEVEDGFGHEIRDNYCEKKVNTWSIGLRS